MNRQLNKTIKIPNQIRAVYNDRTIRVYQAYSDAIAESALIHKTFVCPPFNMNRMTWIKPSFLWMMYRAGWGLKDEGQKRILAIDISHEGFEWALTHSCPSRIPKGMSKEEWQQLKNSSPVRIQWDPERDLTLESLPYRTIQIGLSGRAVEMYVNKWIKNIEETTQIAHQIKFAIDQKNFDLAKSLTPKESIYFTKDFIDDFK